MGFSSQGDLAFNNGTLYLAASNNQLVRIDLANGAVGTAVGPFGFRSVFGLDTDTNRALFGFSHTTVLSVNLSTGVGTPVFDYGGHGLGRANGASFPGSLPPPQSVADLALSITDTPDPVTVGTTLTYTLLVSNNGPAAATGVVLTDTLPSGVNVASLPPSCSGTSTATCNLGTLASGGHTEVNIAVMPTVAGTITNTASVTANEIDPDSSNNTTIRAVTSVQEAQAQLPIVFLLLHGTASEPETWDVLVASRFAGVCPPTRMGEDVTERSLCYRLHFEPRIGWLNGDGSTFRRLGIEVGQAIEKIKNVMQPAAIVLVGHSRGGLAARAYVQGLVEPPPVALGLVTIGTPHQGTPLGRIKRWLADNGFSDLSRTGRAIARFFPREDRYRVKATLFSPSVGYQATAHKKNGKLACNLDDPRSVSYQICKLREGADVLDDWVSTFGQLYSIKLDLGECSRRLRWSSR